MKAATIWAYQGARKMLLPIKLQHPAAAAALLKEMHLHDGDAFAAPILAEIPGQDGVGAFHQPFKLVYRIVRKYCSLVCLHAELPAETGGDFLRSVEAELETTIAELADLGIEIGDTE